MRSSSTWTMKAASYASSCIGAAVAIRTWPCRSPCPAVAHKTALEDIELITRMALRYQNDEIARVLSKLGRRTGKGNRWTASRVAYVRKKHRLSAVKKSTSASDGLTLGQATRYCGASDTTLMKLIRNHILVAEQVAPNVSRGTRRRIRRVCLTEINHLHNGGIMCAHRVQGAGVAGGRNRFAPPVGAP